MKRTLQTITTVSAALLLWASPARTQETPEPKSGRPVAARDRLHDSQRANRLNSAAKASDVIGMTVKNNQDEKIGKVDDLAVDVESGRVVLVILSTGGFVGIGDKLTAVPPGAFHFDGAQKVLHLEATKEKLNAAPKFEMSRWAECCESNQLAGVYRHYGEESAFQFVERGHSTPKTTAHRKADGTWDKDRVSQDSQSMIPASRLSQAQKVSKVVGMSVKNLQDEKLGKVEDLLVDLAAGRIVAVIISSGGFLGLGDELSAIPPTALGFTSGRDNLQLDASKELLSKGPHFKAHQWPDFAEPTYADGVYRAYQVEPYFSTNSTRQPDNTARNARDRDNRTATPAEQGNNQADLETTAQIRKEIIAKKNMSVNARNVKVITSGGQVTLRGPVNNEDEKRTIGEIADRIAQNGNVNNQLEVKQVNEQNN